MSRSIFISLCCLYMLSGCEVLQQFQQQPAQTENVEVEPQQQEEATRVCLFDQPELAFEHNCDLGYWINFRVEHDAVSWPKRRNMIAELGDGADDTLRKILLSQSKGTPYQNRLRAQGWADQLNPSLTSEMREILNVLVYGPSQEILEFESALTVLSRLNTEQLKELEKQKYQLEEKQQQIDQLLKIEASMMEKKEGISQ